MTDTAAAASSAPATPRAVIAFPGAPAVQAAQPAAETIAFPIPLADITDAGLRRISLRCTRELRRRMEARAFATNNETVLARVELHRARAAERCAEDAEVEAMTPAAAAAAAVRMDAEHRLGGIA